MRSLTYYTHAEILLISFQAKNTTLTCSYDQQISVLTNIGSNGKKHCTYMTTSWSTSINCYWMLVKYYSYQPHIVITGDLWVIGQYIDLHWSRTVWSHYDREDCTVASRLLVFRGLPFITTPPWCSMYVRYEFHPLISALINESAWVCGI